MPYTIVVAQLSAGFTSGLVSGLSDAGTIAVGTMTQPLPLITKAMKWRASTGAIIATLPALSIADMSAANRITGDGSTVVVGTSQDIGGLPRAVYWDGANVIHQLTEPVGFTEHSTALGVDNSGNLIVGSCAQDVTQVAFPVVWTAGVPAVLPLLPGGTFAVAQDISTDGTTIVGAGDDAGAITRPIKWVGGVATELPAFAGSNPDADGDARAVNSDGSVIVGKANQTNLPFGSHVNVWKGATVTQLSNWNSEIDTGTTVDVNNSGSIVGGSTRDINFNRYAALWTNDTISKISNINSAIFAVAGAASVFGGISLPSGLDVPTIFLFNSGSPVTPRAVPLARHTVPSTLPCERRINRGF